MSYFHKPIFGCHYVFFIILSLLKFLLLVYSNRTLKYRFNISLNVFLFDLLEMIICSPCPLDYYSEKDYKESEIEKEKNMDEGEPQ